MTQKIITSLFVNNFFGILLRKTKKKRKYMEGVYRNLCTYECIYSKLRQKGQKY